MLIPSSTDHSTSCSCETQHFRLQLTTPSSAESRLAVVREAIPQELADTRTQEVANQRQGSEYKQQSALETGVLSCPLDESSRGLQESEFNDEDLDELNITRQEAQNLGQTSDLFTNNTVVPNLNTPAAPLMPLTERDMKALAGFFERDDAEKLESDINNYMRLIYPEPCWEDNPFDFLRDYL